jgi:hypothetical protein
MSDFVRPEVQRLPLSHGRFVDVRKQLTHGEREDFLATIAPYDLSGSSKLDRRLLRTTRVLTYLLGWSLVDDKGSPVPIGPELSETQRRDTIRSLDPVVFDELHAAILAHETANYAARSDPKNIPSGDSESKLTSPSLAAVE